MSKAKIQNITEYKCKCGLKTLWFGYSERLPAWLKCQKCGKRMLKTVSIA